MTGWTRILERVPNREIGTRGFTYFKEGRIEELSTIG
jgi:hypothetical protein